MRRDFDTKKNWPTVKQIYAVLYTVISIGVIYAIWYAASRIVPDGRVSGPIQTFSDLAKNWSTAPDLTLEGLPTTGYFGNLIYTVINVFIGVSIGTILGAIFGIIGYWNKTIDALGDNLLLVVGTAPIVVVMPFFILWFGIFAGTQVLIVALYSGMLITMYTKRATAHFPDEFVSYGKGLGASGMKVTKSVLLPGILPEVLGGLRIALAGAWGIEVFAEELGARAGIGQILSAYSVTDNVPGLMSAALLLAIVGLIVDAVIVIIFNRVIFRWR